MAWSQKYRLLHGPKCYWRNYFSVAKTGWSQHPPETQQDIAQSHKERVAVRGDPDRLESQKRPYRQFPECY